MWSDPVYLFDWVSFWSLTNYALVTLVFFLPLEYSKLAFVLRNNVCSFFFPDVFGNPIVLELAIYCHLECYQWIETLPGQK